MHIKGGRAKRELAELENRERYAVRKLVEVTMKKNKEKEGKNGNGIFFIALTHIRMNQWRNRVKNMDEGGGQNQNHDWSAV